MMLTPLFLASFFAVARYIGAMRGDVVVKRAAFRLIQMFFPASEPRNGGEHGA